MANRDLSNFRTVNEIVPDAGSSGLLIATGEMGQKIIDTSQKAKIAENLSAAQLDLNKLDNQFRIDNEANPFDKKAIEAYKTQRKSILSGYQSDIGSLWARDFDAQADNLVANSDLQMENWGLKQAQTNTLTSIDNMAQNHIQLISQHGLDYGRTGEGDLDTMLDFQASKEQLMQFAKDSGVVGEVTAAKLIKGYEAEIATNFLGAVASQNPYRAKSLLDSGKFDNAIEVKDRITLQKQIDRGIKSREASAISNELKTLKMQINDPAGYGEKQGWTIEQTVGFQKDPSTASVIGNAKAELLATSLNKIQDPQQLNDALAKINETYGEYASNALNDLSKHGLDNNTRLYATLVNSTSPDPQTADALFNMAQLRDLQGKPVSPQKIAQDILTTRGDETKVSDIEAMALSKTNDWLEVNVAGKNNPADIAVIGQKVKDLSAYYVAKGYDIEQATDKATQWLTSGMAIKSINNHKFMLPDDMGNGDIFATTPKNILEDKLDSLKVNDVIADDITRPDYTEKDYIADIKTNGGWVNSRDNRGLLLVDHNGLYVYGKDGRVISTSIDDLKKQVLESNKKKDVKPNYGATAAQGEANAINLMLGN